MIALLKWGFNCPNCFRDQQDPLALQENQVWMETMEKMAKMVGMEETHSYYQLCPANHV